MQNLFASKQHYDPSLKRGPINQLDPAILTYDFEDEVAWEPFLTPRMRADGKPVCFYQPRRVSTKPPKDRLRTMEQQIEGEIKSQARHSTSSPLPTLPSVSPLPTLGTRSSARRLLTNLPTQSPAAEVSPLGVAVGDGASGAADFSQHYERLGLAGVAGPVPPHATMHDHTHGRSPLVQLEKALDV